MKSVCQLYSYNTTSLDILYNDEEFFSKEENFSINKLNKEKVFWLNYHRISEKKTIEQFWINQKFHILSLEDVYTERMRPKVEDFESYIFFSIQSALPMHDNNFMLKKEQLSFILGPNYLISLQEKSSDHFTEVRDKINNAIGRTRERGADFLLFRLLDAITDNYFEVLDHIAELIRNLDSRVMRTTTGNILSSIEFQKRKLTELRKIVIPMRDIAITLERQNSKLLSPETQPYFSDLKDSCLSILDDIESNKQALESLTNLYYAAQSQRMNEIMKVLTVVSAIFIPLTFIAGVYGMNFKYMPELQYRYGYYVVMGAMFLVGLGLLLFFIKRGWLKKK